MRHTMSFLLLIPRNLCVVILWIYRAVISFLYGDVCRYYLFCSVYVLWVIQEYGMLRGSVMGAVRIARCHSWAAGCIDDVPLRRREKYAITRFGFVIASSHGKG